MTVDRTTFFATKRTFLAAFVAFVCFAVAAERPYIAAAGLEFFITLAFLLLYLLKLNKRFSYLCWPLMVRTFLIMCRNFTKLYLDVSLPSIFQDVANSLVAAVFIFIISLVAVSTYSDKRLPVCSTGDFQKGLSVVFQ
uniref:MARVEL domain-containing protein n=1 Tax=Paramormyrops kingsleyae TaxID=1676925 RepID=A0A3B3QSC5_9TELE